MPRATLNALLLSLAVGGSVSEGVQDVHIDLGLLPRGCAACHEGHGESGSPMLPAPQKELCLSCHGSVTAVAAQVSQNALSSNARPPSLSSALSKSFVHPLTRNAYSREERGAVTCSSCHSPHRGQPGASAAPLGTPAASTRDPQQFEYELCQSCHRSMGGGDFSNVNRVFSPSNRSYHPVEAPAAERSPSVLVSLSARQINCTDCHGNDDPAGPRGLHGSNQRFLLNGSYPTVDGSPESSSAYALCYSCHERSAVLDSPLFPYHRVHIVDERASCATCHNGHGSITNRALIRFGEETVLGGVSPSLSTGQFGFVSDAPGSGECYLTCHGRDHAPEAYGVWDPFTSSGSDFMELERNLGTAPPSNELPNGPETQWPKPDEGWNLEKRRDQR